jgi:hypothetical protein
LAGHSGLLNQWETIVNNSNTAQIDTEAKLLFLGALIASLTSIVLVISNPALALAIEMAAQ